MQYNKHIITKEVWLPWYKTLGNFVTGLRKQEILRVNLETFSMFFSFFIREAAFVADGLLLFEKTCTELGHKKPGRHNVILGLCSLLFPFPL